MKLEDYEVLSEWPEWWPVDACEYADLSIERIAELEQQLERYKIRTDNCYDGCQKLVHTRWSMPGCRPR